MGQASASAMISPTVSPVSVAVPLKQTLQMSFSQTSWSISSKHLTLKPASLQSAAMRSSRGVTAPFASPSRTNSMPLW